MSCSISRIYTLSEDWAAIRVKYIWILLDTRCKHPTQVDSYPTGLLLFKGLHKIVSQQQPTNTDHIEELQDICDAIEKFFMNHDRVEFVEQLNLNLEEPND